MPNRLKNKTALITGGAQGFGKGIASKFKEEGAKVIISDINKALGEETAKGLGVSFLEHDVGDPTQWEKAISEIKRKEGKLNILVNNAGITRDGLLMRMKDDDWDAVLEVNMTASMSLCRAAMRGMMKARTGRIISISSVVGVTGNAGQTNYAASKAAMIGFSKSLAAEVASRGLTVNVVAPGFIETPMTDVLDESQKSALLTRVPAGRLGQADEIAATVAFLASDEAAYITGSTLHVNGGMAML